MSRTERSSDGFSLVEVVVAVGVFVAGVVAALALLSQTTRSAGVRLEEATAARVTASAIALVQTSSWEDALEQVQATEPWYVDRSGVRLGVLEDVTESERFFEVQFLRDESLAPSSAGDTAALWAGWIELRWPVATPAAGTVAAENQSTLRQRLVINR